MFELIQNAEDNIYTSAKRENYDPYLSFNVFPDRIIIDSNEDGFTTDDVQAICSTGESQKLQSKGYIGEKGIGFKSVFKLAKRAHIQSGPFSFSFHHSRSLEDSGLGMVTPLDEDHEQLAANIRTRITLDIFDDMNFQDSTDDVLNIPDTLLLFLDTLKTLRVNQYFPCASREVEYEHRLCEGGQKERITKTIKFDSTEDRQTTFYWVFRKQVDNLPEEPSRKSIRQATVVLAFPVNEHDIPIVCPQYVYAYLPIRIAGFTVCLYFPQSTCQYQRLLKEQCRVN